MAFKKLGVGIIGCGNISTAYLKLAPNFQALEMVGVADLNHESAKAQAEAFGVRAESVEGLLASPDVDIIVNLTVPQAHFEVSKQALNAGKHVYSEKPFVLSLEEGKVLKTLSQENGLAVGSAPDTFLGGAHQRARAAIDTGDIGEVIAGSCHVMSRGMESWHPNPDFFFQPGGGPVLDLGPYYITNLIQLIGPVKAVSAMASASFASRTIGSGPRAGETVPVDTPTNVHGIMEFSNGALITLSMSWDVTAHNHREMELYGTTGSLFLPDPNFFGGEVLINADKANTATPLSAWDHPFAVDNITDGGGSRRANYRCAGLSDMAVAVQSGRDFRCNQDVALHAVDVMTSLLKSAEQRGWIELTTTCARPDALRPEEARSLLA